MSKYEAGSSSRTCPANARPRPTSDAPTECVKIVTLDDIPVRVLQGVEPLAGFLAINESVDVTNSVTLYSSIL